MTQSENTILFGKDWLDEKEDYNWANVGSDYYEFSEEQDSIIQDQIQGQMEVISLHKEFQHRGDTKDVQPVRRIRKQNKRRKSSRKGGKKRCSKPQSDYKKNICGYITKKAMRQFTGPAYQDIVEQICSKEQIKYDSVWEHYQPLIQRVTGPSHLRSLFQPSKADDASIKKIFLFFFKWFLRERYTRHLFLQGKMEHKKMYIQYKNRELLPMINQIQKQLNQQLQPASTILQLNDFVIQTI